MKAIIGQCTEKVEGRAGDAFLATAGRLTCPEERFLTLMRVCGAPMTLLLIKIERTLGGQESPSVSED